MKMTRIKRLGLSTAQENKLWSLKEQETIYAELLRHNDSFWIGKELVEVNELLTELLIKKEAIEKRQACSPERLAELNRQLTSNRRKQTAIVSQGGLLGKLKKAIKAIEENKEKDGSVS